MANTDKEIMDEIEEHVRSWKASLKLRGEVEDLIQDVALKLVAANRWECNPGYINRVTRNHLLDVMKQKGITTVDLEWAEDVPAPAASPEQKEWLDKHLKSFGWPAQKAIRLYILGYSYAEIGHEIGLSARHTEKIIRDTTNRLSEKYDRWSDN